jgi:hypothetical protein
LPPKKLYLFKNFLFPPHINKCNRTNATEIIMAQNGRGLQAIKYSRGKLEVLDQLRLPHEFVYDIVSTCEEAFDCIKAMRVRGACPDAMMGFTM